MLKRRHAETPPLTFYCAIHRARLADLLAVLGIEEGDAARANMLVAGTAYNLKLTLLLAAPIHLRLIRLHSP